MRYFLRVMARIFLCASCCGVTTQNSRVNIVQDGDGEGAGGDYTANAEAIEQKKQEMLATGGEVNFWFSGDEELRSQDPHAYWLMNRMMRMV